MAAYITSNLSQGEFKLSVIDNHYSFSDKGSKCERVYLLLTSKTNSQAPTFFSTYNENLNTKNNSQYSLTFSILKKHNEMLNPFFYMMVENRRLRLELEDNKIIDFVITGITPKDTSKNIEYSVTCQDAFSFDLSKHNILISYSGLVLPIDKHGQNILYTAGLESRYEIEHNLEIGGYERFPNLLTTTLIDTTKETKTSLDIKDSTPYTAFVKLCEQYNALLDVQYPIADTDKTVIRFHNLDTIPYKGLTLNPNVNLNSFSFSSKSDNFCSVLRVSGGEDAYGNKIGLLPDMPSKVRMFLLENIEAADNAENIESIDSAKNEENTEKSNFLNKTTLQWIGDFYSSDYGKNLTSDEDIEINNFFTALSTVVTSGGDVLYNFDYFKEKGLMSAEVYDNINKYLQTEMRNANIRTLIYTTQYNILYADYLNRKYKEEEDIVLLAAIQELNFNIKNGKLEGVDSADAKATQISKNNGSYDDHLKSLQNLWNSDNMDDIGNYSIVDKSYIKYTDLLAYLFGKEYFYLLDTQKVAKALNDDSYDLEKLSFREGLLYKLYKAVSLYNEYKNKMDKAKGEMNFDDGNSSSWGEDKIARYADYAYYKDLMDEQTPYIDEYNSEIIRLGYYTTYLALVGGDKPNKKGEYTYDWVNFVYGNSDIATKIKEEIPKIRQFKNGVSSNDKIETLNELVEKSNINVNKTLKDKIDASIKARDEVWQYLYDNYNDYIIESSYTDSNQLSNEGLYLIAKKQLVSYSSPTVSYSSTVINMEDIDNSIKHSIELGDIVYLYNENISSKYSGQISIKIFKDNNIKFYSNLKYGEQYFQIKKVEKHNDFIELFVEVSDLSKANEIIGSGANFYINDIPLIVISKKLEMTASPIPLQITGISKNLRQSTTSLTISTNRITNNVLGKILRQVK